MKRVFLALMMVFGVSGPVLADQVLYSYFAQLSSNDHYNSRGVRLQSAEAIIQQDRANYHKYGERDYNDEYDGFFTNLSRRQMIPGMLRRGTISNQVKNYIVNNDVGIWVEIWSGSNGKYLVVQMPG